MRKNKGLALCGVLGLAAGLLWWSNRTTEPSVEVAPDPDGSEAVVTEHTPVDFEFRRPPPTEHWLGDGAETVNKQRRKAWFKERHKAPPDVDVKAVERANGLAQLQRRNAIARGELDEPVFAREDGEPYPTPVWAERGSDNQAGRMHVAVHSPDHETLYAGSALGSIWKWPLDGGEWSAIGDNLYGGAHWLAVLPADDEGDPFVVIAANDGGLIHRTEDDGQTWEVPDGVGNPWWIRRLLVTSDDSRTIFLITGTNWSYTLKRSTDGGRSFEDLRALGGYAGDVWASRTGDPAVYLIDDGELLRSDDLGDSFEVVGTLPHESDGAELAGSEAGAPRLYAVIDEARLWRSADAGVSWHEMHGVEDYWRSLAASIHDENLIVWGGVECHRSTDGGQNFEIVNDWYDYYEYPATRLHADIPGIDVVLDPDGNEIWYVSTDGGLFRSTNGLATVENLSLQGLRVSQYYDVHTSTANPDHVAAGSQDQGYQLTHAAEVNGGMEDFDQLLSGDYGHLVSGDGSHEYVYSVYPGFILAQVGEDQPYLDWIDFPEGEYYAWLPPLYGDSTDNTAFFFAATHLYRYELGGEGWTPVRWSEQDFGDGAYEYMSAFAISPLDPQRAYAATNAGRMFWSDDRGKTWSESSSTGPEPHWFYGTALLPSSWDVDTVFAAGSGYGATAVYRSEDGGKSWAPWDAGLPDTLVYCLGEAPDGSRRLFAGTETAAYMRTADGRDDWVDITGADAPVTIYWSVESLTAENTMRFGTYGRGIWDYRLDEDHVGCFPVQDYDGDGHDCDVDCQDHDPSIHPGVEDVCDGVDVNCDDQDPVEVDADGDGYLGCEECDDGNRGASPDAAEICGNGLDEDCDGVDAPCEDDGGCACRSLPAPRPSGSAIVIGLAALAVLRRRGAR